MSNTQGEPTKGRRNWVATTAVAAVMVAVLGTVGVTVVKANADAQAHTALMVEVKADGRTLNAASAEDTALASSVVEAGQIAHIQAVAAEQVAVKVAAEQAAAAEAARVAAEQAAAQQAAADLAAQQVAASKQTTRQAPATNGAPAAGGLPAGSPVPTIPGTGAPDTTACASGSASTINGVPTCD